MVNPDEVGEEIVAMENRSSPLSEHHAPCHSVDALLNVIRSRRNVSLRHLVVPGPNSAQQQVLLAAATRAPDHGRIRPWHLIEITPAQRQLLSEAFVRSLCHHTPNPDETQIEKARIKAFHAPFLLLQVIDGPDEGARIDIHERTLSAGCGVQNLLLTATAMGFGSGLSSGSSLQSPAVRACFGLTDHQKAICFIGIGTDSRPPLRTPA